MIVYVVFGPDEPGFKKIHSAHQTATGAVQEAHLAFGDPLESIGDALEQLKEKGVVLWGWNTTIEKVVINH